MMGFPDKQLQEARRCLESGNFKQVLALCRPLLRGMPHEAEFSALVGAALLGLGRAFQALGIISPACEVNPERADLQLLRISCLLEGGAFQLARQSAERALRFAPDNADFSAVLAKADLRIAELNELIASAPRPLLSESQRALLQKDFRKNYRLVPIIINSRDRRSCLEQLLAWLRSAGYANVAILDNDSTYPPLVEYLQAVRDEILVLRSRTNLGPRALWSSGLISLLGDVPFVYTDPDVVPTEDCPADAVLKLADALAKFQHAPKAGLGIMIDDIPDTFDQKYVVQAWETRYWQRPLPGNCYGAMLDTTFALYRPGSWHNVQAVRTGPPYLVRHLPWYADSSKPSQEEQYYAEHAASSMASWSGRNLSKYVPEPFT